jgi:hypothetical protein
MANAEYQLLSRIVGSGNLGTVIDWGIQDGDFRTNEGKSVWRYIAGYYADAKTRGSVLGANAFATVFPQLQLWDDPSMTTDALCVEVRRARIIAEARESCLALTENIEVDPAGAIATLHVHMQSLLALGDSKNHDVTFRDAIGRLVNRYEQRKNDIYAFAKMPWPWDIMNECTGGIQDDDFIVLYGRPKSMKTWVLVVLLAWAFQNEKTVLIYTKEMTPDNIFQRIAATICQIPYQELRNGKLMPHDELLLMSLARMLQDKYMRANLVCLDGREAGAGGDTVPWIQSKIEKYKPDLVFIDGMYLLSDVTNGKKGPTADWLRVTNISRAVRSMILHTHTPVVATMQANRGAAKHSDGNLDEIAYADAVAQDATIAMRVINEKWQNTIACVMAGSREFRLHGFRINGKPATDFTFHSVMTEEEIKAAEEKDAPDEDGKKKKAKKPRTRTDATSDDAQEKLKNQQLRNM